jgi:hypothetical protein
MNINEAKTIARGRASEHAPVTFDLAARVLSTAGKRYCDLAQLALIKSDLQRARASFDVGDDNHARGRIDAARLTAYDNGVIWSGK